MRHIRHWISRKQLEIEPWFKGPSIMAYGGIRSCDRWRHVSDPERSSSDPNTLRVKYRENSWRCYWATIANYWIVRCDAVRSAILATAWLLVTPNCMFYPISARNEKCGIPNVNVFSFWGLRSPDPWPGAEVWGAKAIPLNPVGAQSPYPQNIHPIPRSLFLIWIKHCITSVAYRPIRLCLDHNNDFYYRAMQFSAKRGIAIACRLSVCLFVRPSVRL